MKYRFLILFLIIYPSLWSQSDHSTKLSTAHINIPGTKVFIIPGEGFKLSENMVGLQKDGNTGIAVFDLDGGNFSSNARNVNRANFEERGFKVKEYTELTINGYPAKLVCLYPDEKMMAYQLVLGDSVFSVMLMATCEAADTKSADAIRKSLLSVIYDKSFFFDALKTAFFTMDVKDSRFKFSGAASSMYMYTINGAKKENIEKEERFVMVATTANEGMTAEMVTIMMLQGLAENGFNDLEILSRTQTKVNGYEAFEIKATGKVRGKERRIYHLALVHDKKSVVFQGYSENDFETDFAEFEKLSKTIKFK